MTHRNIPIVITDIADTPVEADISVSTRVCDVADMVNKDLVICPCVLEVMKAIHAKYPKLAFADFLVAVRLCELANRQPGGHA